MSDFYSTDYDDDFSHDPLFEKSQKDQLAAQQRLLIGNKSNAALSGMVQVKRPPSGKVRASEIGKLFDAKGVEKIETIAKNLARRQLGLGENDSYGDSIAHGIRSEPKALKIAMELMGWDSLEFTGENQLRLEFDYWSGYPDGIIDGLYPCDAKSPTSNNTWSKLLLCKDLSDFKQHFSDEYHQLQAYIMGCESKFEQLINYGYFIYYFEKNENNALFFQNTENEYMIRILRIPADRKLWNLLQHATKNACHLRDEKHALMTQNSRLQYVEWDLIEKTDELLMKTIKSRKTKSPSKDVFDEGYNEGWTFKDE
jgi:hypothetical protein